MPIVRLNRLMVLLLVSALTVAVAVPVNAQNSSRIYGVITDAEGNPVPGASIEIDFTGGLNRNFSLTSNEDGEYIQVGLSSGPYNVVVTSDEHGVTARNLTLTVGQEFELDIEYLPPGAVDREFLSDEDLAKLEAAEATAAGFADGVEAANRGDWDEAASAFASAAEAIDDCGDCYRNLGIVELRRENYEEAEGHLRRATEIDPSDAAAFTALADVYNAQRRFDEAGQASAAAREASGGGGAAGGDAGAVFDQALIAWNAGRIDDARGLFEQTLALDPEHGEANYWMGMASLNGGLIPEAVTFMRTYVEREPDGRFAAEAAALLSQLAP